MRDGQCIGDQSEPVHIPEGFIQRETWHVKRVTRRVERPGMLAKGGDMTRIADQILNFGAGLSEGIGKQRRHFAQFFLQARVGIGQVRTVSRQQIGWHVQMGGCVSTDGDPVVAHFTNLVPGHEA